MDYLKTTMLLTAIALAGAGCQTTPDVDGAMVELETARATHTARQKEAAAALDKAFDREINKLVFDGKSADAEALIGEQTAFAIREVLPKAPVMEGALAEYDLHVLEARIALLSAYGRAIKASRAAGQDERTQKLRAEMKKLADTAPGSGPTSLPAGSP